MLSQLITLTNPHNWLSLTSRKLNQVLPNNSVTLTADYQHSDLLLINPTDQQSITITQIRSLNQQLIIKPIIWLYKLAIINAAHQLTLPAQNALLKSLEEPPEFALIILITDQPDKLLPTITSRCQITRHTESIILDTTISHLLDICQQPPISRLQFTSQHSKDRDQAKHFCQQHLTLLHQQLRQSLNSSEIPLSRPQLYQSLTAFTTALRHLDANTPPQLTIDHLLLSLPQI